MSGSYASNNAGVFSVPSIFTVPTRQEVLSIYPTSPAFVGYSPQNDPVKDWSLVDG